MQLNVKALDLIPSTKFFSIWALCKFGNLCLERILLFPQMKGLAVSAWDGSNRDLNLSAGKENLSVAKDWGVGQWVQECCLGNTAS